MANWKRNLRRRRRLQYLRSKTSNLKRSRQLMLISKFGFGGLIILLLASFIIIPIFATKLPSPDKVVRREGFATKIVDRNGKALYDIYEEERRSPVEFDQIPEYLKQATIAIEDKNFYTHQGFDPMGMVRGLSRFFTRGYAQGGSTLTQQLVKNVLLNPERTIFRKVREFILAIQIERKYSKDEILQMYLNEAPYGGTAWGVESASETYFGKNVNELTLVESAFLAGLPQRPSYYSPYSTHPDSYVGRTEQVLRRMREDGYITDEQEEHAKEEIKNLGFIGKGVSFKAPHFVQYVQTLLEEKYGESIIAQGGLRVTTSLDIDLQDEAQKIVSEEIEEVEYLNITNGAAVVMDPETGEVLAMVGSKNFNDPDYDGQVNVTLSLRQPGSAIKPITYVTALKEGYTASTLVMDVPTEFPGGAGQPPYKPGNYDGKYRGPIQLRYALGNSINIPAVKVLAMVGIQDTLETAYDMGLSTLKPDKETLSRVGLSLTLGGGDVKLLELTQAYSAFMNQGFRVDPVAILKVEDINGKVLEEVKPKKGKRVLSEEEAYIMADILSDNSARELVFGTNSLLNIPGRKIAVKTGTTNNKRDNWTLGGNSQVVVGVWVGNNDNTEMKEVASGISGASPIWRNILLKALDGKPNVGFDEPSGIVTSEIDSVSGYVAHDGFPSRKEIYIRGTEPREDPVHVKLKICKSEGKLATPSDIASGNSEDREFFVFKEDDPTAGDGEPNKWQEGIDAWLSGQSDSRYHPPTDFCGTSNPVNVEFDSPRDHDSNLSNEFEVRITAASTADIEIIELEVDGVKIRSFTAQPYRHTLNLSNGVHELRAKARDKNGKESDRKITIGVGVPWDYSPSPTPTPTTILPSPIPTL